MNGDMLRAQACILGEDIDKGLFWIRFQGRRNVGIVVIEPRFCEHEASPIAGEIAIVWFELSTRANNGLLSRLLISFYGKRCEW
jgi:hypothetical protein